VKDILTLKEVLNMEKLEVRIVRDIRWLNREIIEIRQRLNLIDERMDDFYARYEWLISDRAENREDGKEFGE